MKDTKTHEDQNGSTSLRGERDNTNEVQGEKGQSKCLHLSHFLPTSRRIVQFSNGEVSSAHSIIAILRWLLLFKV